MNTLQRYMPFLASAMLLCVVFCFIYPHYQYYIDPDGTAYLTISQRYANGDYARAINGYWSPWGCWLTALLIKAGIAAMPASAVVNAMGAVGFLGVSFHLFRWVGMADNLVWVMQVTLALFLCYAVFWQSFDDLWECFFLMCAFCLLLHPHFEERMYLWALYGIACALAYFAKAYSLPFLVVYAAVILYFLSMGDNKKLFTILGVSLGVMFVCILPWLIALHNKYDIWTTSTAGTLNMSWYLVGHPQWKQGIDLLIPPVYPDSPYYWEDPYLANGPAPHFWNSFYLLGLQLVRIGMNLWKLLKSWMLLSIFFPFAALDFIGLIRRFLAQGEDDEEYISPDLVLMGVAFFIFIGGYLLINFEPRYLWFLVPFVMIVMAMSIQGLRRPAFKRAMIIIVPLSFLIYPVKCMVTMYNEGKQEYEMAQQLKQLNIHGTFAAAVFPGLESQRVERLAYFSGNAYYALARPTYTPQEILRDMRRYHVQYYYEYKGAGNGFADEQGKQFPELTGGKVAGLRVFLVNP